MSLKEIAHKNIQMVFVRRFAMTYIFSLETFFFYMNIQQVFFSLKTEADPQIFEYYTRTGREGYVHSLR